MTLPPGIKITSELLWRGTLLFALLDLALVPILAWRIKPGLFRQLKWTLVLITALFWSMLWAWALDWAWDSIYSYIFPLWIRAWLPLLQGVHFATFALVIWWGALHFSKPVIAFCLFGGSWGLVTHVWAVYLGIVDKPPILHGASPPAAVVFAVFEFTLYWCLILGVSYLVWRGWRRLLTGLVGSQVPLLP